MASLFDTLQAGAFRAGVSPRTKASQNWFRRKVNELKTINKLYQLFARKNNSLNKQRQLSLIGKQILNFTCKEINLLL